MNNGRRTLDSSWKFAWTWIERKRRVWRQCILGEQIEVDAATLASKPAKLRHIFKVSAGMDLQYSQMVVVVGGS
jgi:hypothetical protein